jgi:DNA-binding NtrC family response regulator
MRKDLPTGLIVGPARGRAPLVALLRQAGFAAKQAGDGAAAARALRESRLACVITRLSAPRLDGFLVLALARERHPAAPVVVLGERIDAETEAALYAQGADDVQQGTWHSERLAAVLRRALERAALERRASELEERLDRRYRTDPLTGASPAIQRVVDQIRHVAPTRAMVLIEGERGAGKSRVARAIHHGSPRRESTFVRVSLGALTADQAEAALFGDSASLERADHGTLFPRRDRPRFSGTAGALAE